MYGHKIWNGDSQPLGDLLKSFRGFVGLPRPPFPHPPLNISVEALIYRGLLLVERKVANINALGWGLYIILTKQSIFLKKTLILYC